MKMEFDVILIIGLDYVGSSMIFNMKMAYHNFLDLCFFLLFQFLHDISLGYATITLLKLLVIGHFTHNKLIDVISWF